MPHHPGQRGQAREQRAPSPRALHGQDVRGRQSQDGRQDGGAHEHRAPAEGLPGQSAQHPGRHDAGEQARDDGRDVAGPPVRGGALGDQRHQELRYDGRRRGDQDRRRERAGPGRRGTGDQGGRRHQRQDADQTAPVHAVPERGEEQQPGGVPELRDGGQPGHRRGGGAEVVGDEGEQRCRQVDVGGRDGGAHRDQGEEETGDAGGGSLRCAAGRALRRGPGGG